MSGRGKVSPNYFFPRFAKALAEEGYTLSLIPGAHPCSADVVVAIYNEVQFCHDEELRRDVTSLERSAQGKIFVHSGATAEFIADKFAWNRGLASIVPVPQICEDKTASQRVFSNVAVGAHQPVMLIEPDVPLNSKRYNTHYIDTRHSYRGNDFYVCLRAKCVGAALISLLVRARPVSDGDASVHNKDTPLDPDLINALYESVALPRQAEVETICRNIGKRLGLGFYAHDLLPERETGRTFVCESNIKFDEMGLRSHFAPLRDKLAFADSLYGGYVRRAAKAFVSQLPSGLVR